MTRFGPAFGVRALAVAGVLGLVAILPTAQAYHQEQLRRDAHRLDDQLDDLRNALLLSAHHQEGGFFSGQEMRLIMSVSALRGQTDSLHWLLDRREPADVRVAFREMANLANQIDRDIRFAHTARGIQELWFRARTTLNALGRDMYDNPRWEIGFGGGTIFLPFPGGNSPWGDDHYNDPYSRRPRDH